MSENKGIAGQFIIGDGLQQGGVIEPGELVMFGNGSPETVYLPKGAQVHPIAALQQGVTVKFDDVQITPHGQQLLQEIIESATVDPDPGPLWPFWSLDQLQAFVDRRVRVVLEEDAREIATNKAFQPVTTHKQAGICCACLGSGDDMVWVGHRLAHRDEACMRKAAEMEPVREHRG